MKRFSRTAKKEKKGGIGIVFDIDGVLVRGKTVLPNATESLLRLKENVNIPHVFLTNGGGDFEATKAEQITNALGIDVDADTQVIVSHTPMRKLVPKYGNKRVLVVGRGNVLAVARGYGFKKVVSPQQFVLQHPEEYPFRVVDEPLQDDEFAEEPIGAIFIMFAPIDWNLELQIVMDVLRGVDAVADPDRMEMGKSRQVCEIFNTSQDLVIVREYPHPRLSQGGFLECLIHLFKKITGFDLEIGRFGKPFKVTFDYALDLLKEQSGEDEFEVIYMIGDNPNADIKGANDAGKPWFSILVKTGVYSEETKAIFPNHKAKLVCEGVGEAIDYIFKRHGLS